MFGVELYATIRQLVFLDGLSRREVARRFGISRDAVLKMRRYAAPPGYVRAKPIEHPKLGPFLGAIDAIVEADETAPVKQRHTAKRIRVRLCDEHGFAGGYTTAKDYVRRARTRRREVFVPLAHPPGHAQIDFGAAVGVIGGNRSTLHLFCMYLPHSDAIFVKAYPTDGRAARRRRFGVRLFRRRSAIGAPRQHEAGGGAHPAGRDAGADGGVRAAGLCVQG